VGENPTSYFYETKENYRIGENFMTVKELITLLEKEDPKAEVFKSFWIDGSSENETGYEDEFAVYKVSSYNKSKVVIK